MPKSDWEPIRIELLTMGPLGNQSESTSGLVKGRLFSEEYENYLQLFIPTNMNFNKRFTIILVSVMAIFGLLGISIWAITLVSKKKGVESNGNSPTNNKKTFYSGVSDLGNLTYHQDDYDEDIDFDGDIDDTDPKLDIKVEDGNYTPRQELEIKRFLRKFDKPLQKRNLYAVLGVSKSDSTEEIGKAYKKLSRKFHPDRNKAPDATKAIQIVNDAKEILLDADKRRRYDNKTYDFDFACEENHYDNE